MKTQQNECHVLEMRVKAASDKQFELMLRVVKLQGRLKKLTRTLLH
jgi:hypothetical protein